MGRGGIQILLCKLKPIRTI